MLLFLNMSGGEIVVIFLVFLMLFGSKNIPDIARTMGRAVRQFKDATGEIQRDIENGAREFKTRMDQETLQIKSHLDPDILAGQSTPPPPSPPKPTPPTATSGEENKGA
ncbi:MAG TPA: twin-arginine translocase TatA/TatE family subunit [Luteibaculaceae bacterium]|nr:twin-arginine translocase TatA/TatE family subunit [Luteibaculaceae bacterium]